MTLNFKIRHVIVRTTLNNTVYPIYYIKYQICFQFLAITRDRKESLVTSSKHPVSTVHLVA